MRVGDSSVRGDQFDTTRWTLVLASAHEESRTGQEALAALCQIYWYPLYTFARRRGHSPHDAQDLTQGFFLHLLEHRALSQANRLKGKFRSFLLACFQNYLSVEAQRAHALKRGGQRQVVSLDLENAESRYRLEPVDQLTAEKIFDARWALTLLDYAKTVLRQEYVSRGKETLFDTLNGFIGIGNSKASAAPEEAAKTLGVGLGTVKTLIHRLRKRYSAILRREIGRTVSEPAEIDGEIRALCDAIIAAEGRISQ